MSEVAMGVAFFFSLILLLLLSLPADSRDRNVPAAFQREFPCPSTGKTTGACPGWERDHFIPLCAGGPDTVANLNWMSIEDHKAKTNLDMKECRKR
jgi:5-methylcytosine-specific restriction endonuclease McrA